MAHDPEYNPKAVMVCGASSSNGEGRFVSVDNSGNVNVNVAAITGNTSVVGPTAVDAAIATNPVLVAGKADASTTVTPTFAGVNASNDVVNLLLDLFGRVKVVVDKFPSTTSGTNAQVTVDTTATGIEVVATGFKGAVITNQGAVDAYVGLGSVSSANGMKLAAGQSMFLSGADGYSGQIKAITAASSTTFGVLRWA